MTHLTSRKAHLASHKAHLASRNAFRAGIHTPSDSNQSG